MLRVLITHLFIFALLATSVENIVDQMSGQHPHGNNTAHPTNSAQLINSDLSAASGGHEEHCQHCCHGHSTNIAGDPNILCDYSLPDRLFTSFQRQVVSIVQVPPTPPPIV